MTSVCQVWGVPRVFPPNYEVGRGAYFLSKFQQERLDSVEMNDKEYLPTPRRKTKLVVTPFWLIRLMNRRARREWGHI